METINWLVSKSTLCIWMSKYHTTIIFLSSNKAIIGEFCQYMFVAFLKEPYSSDTVFWVFFSAHWSSRGKWAMNVAVHHSLVIEGFLFLEYLCVDIFWKHQQQPPKCCPSTSAYTPVIPGYMLTKWHAYVHRTLLSCVPLFPLSPPTPLRHSCPSLHHLPLCVAEVALMARGSPLVHLFPFIFS